MSVASCPYQKLRTDILALLSTDAEMIEAFLNDVIARNASRDIKWLPACDVRTAAFSTLETIHLCGATGRSQKVIKASPVCAEAHVTAHLHSLTGLDALRIQPHTLTVRHQDLSSDPRITHVYVAGVLAGPRLTAVLDMSIRNCSSAINIECTNSTLTVRDPRVFVRIRVKFECLTPVDAVAELVTVKFGGMSFACGVRAQLATWIMPNSIAEQTLANVMKKTITRVLQRRLLPPPPMRVAEQEASITEKPTSEIAEPKPEAKSVWSRWRDWWSSADADDDDDETSTDTESTTSTEGDVDGGSSDNED
jgi:hypothetical protein